MKTLTNFRIDETMRRDFHIWCIQNGTTIAEHLRQHISQTLNQRTHQNDQRPRRWSVSSENHSNGVPRWEDSY